MAAEIYLAVSTISTLSICRLALKYVDKATKLSGDRKKQVSLLVIVPLVSLIGYMSAKAYKDVSFLCLFCPV